jgi:hypothetical protein
LGWKKTADFSKKSKTKKPCIAARLLLPLLTKAAAGTKFFSLNSVTNITHSIDIQ